MHKEGMKGCSPHTDVYYSITHCGCPSLPGASVLSACAVTRAAATPWMNPSCAHVPVLVNRFGNQVVHVFRCLQVGLVSLLRCALHT